jgi:hypothetical protein
MKEFKNDNGYFADIEVIGERQYYKCYFKVKDIMEAFEMPNLNRNILDNRYDGHIENVHYKFFIQKKRETRKKSNYKR